MKAAQQQQVRRKMWDGRDNGEDMMAVFQVKYVFFGFEMGKWW